MKESNDFINYLDTLKTEDLSSILRLIEIILREIKPNKGLVQFIPTEAFLTEGVSVHFTKSFLRKLVPFVPYFSDTSSGVKLFHKYEGIKEDYINYLEQMAEQAEISDIVLVQDIAKYKSSIFVYSADDEFILLIERLQKKVKAIKKGQDKTPRNKEMIEIKIKENQNQLELGYFVTVNNEHTFKLQPSASSDALYQIAQYGRTKYDKSIYHGLGRKGGALQKQMIKIFKEPKRVVRKKGSILTTQPYITLRAS